MANTRLTQKDIDDLKQMAINGVAPEDIATHFKIAVSTVHAHKARFKEEGTEMPNVRGQRPKGFATPENDPENQSKINIGTLRATGNRDFRLVYNGTRVNISSEALEVNVTKEGVEVTY